MNKGNYIQTGGFPFNTERLAEIETAFSIFNALGTLAGNLTIISGCTIAGSSVGNGFVYIDGELYDFKAGDFTAESTVIIIEENINKPFESSEIKTVHTIRYATFGTNPEASWLWTDFKRVDPMVTMMTRLAALEKKSAVFQAGGGMVLWNKPATDIPTGWAEVVDWRGRMPVGFDEAQAEFNLMGKTGGAKNKTLSIDEMPEHDHDADGDGGTTNSTGSRFRKESDTDGVPLKTKKTGGGQQFSLMNPYRVVLFIEYIG